MNFKGRRGNGWTPKGEKRLNVFPLLGLLPDAASLLLLQLSQADCSQLFYQ